MLVLTLDDTGREFKFGCTKAVIILQNLVAIREFAASEDHPTAKRMRTPRPLRVGPAQVYPL